MSELGIFSTFTNSELGCSITTLKVNDDIWLIGTDFATALEYVNPRKAIRDHVDESDKFYFQDLDTGDCTPDETSGPNLRGRNESFPPFKIQPHTVVISEAGAYCLILRSKLPAAKEFTKWVTKEVIPTIRKTGTYTIPEGALPKLKDIKPRDVYNLCGSERHEFKCLVNEMKENLKSYSAVQRGRRGGLKTQEQIREVKYGNKTLRSQTAKLQEENTELEKQVEELTQEIEAMKSGIAEILADDY